MRAVLAPFRKIVAEPLSITWAIVTSSSRGFFLAPFIPDTGEPNLPIHHKEAALCPHYSQQGHGYSMTTPPISTDRDWYGDEGDSADESIAITTTIPATQGNILESLERCGRIGYEFSSTPFGQIRSTVEYEPTWRYLNYGNFWNLIRIEETILIRKC